jgi:hypothetical protein
MRGALSGRASQHVKPAEPLANLVPTGECLGHQPKLLNLRDWGRCCREHSSVFGGFVQSVCNTPRVAAP